MTTYRVNNGRGTAAGLVNLVGTVLALILLAHIVFQFAKAWPGNAFVNWVAVHLRRDRALVHQHVHHRRPDFHHGAQLRSRRRFLVVGDRHHRQPAAQSRVRAA